jgi:sugar phosphate isomerase/epimerase
MRIGYNTWSMATVPYHTFIPALADIGFGAIAISVVPAYTIGEKRVENAGALEHLSADDRRRIKGEFVARDLKLPSVIGNQSLVHEDLGDRQRALDRLRQTIDLCVELALDGDVPTMNTGTGGKNGDLDDPRCVAMIVDGLGELAEYAARSGVVVCVEPHVNAPIDSIERAEWLVQAVSSPALRLDFDVSHFEVQGIAMDESVARLLPLSAAAEVKDQLWRVASSSSSASRKPAPVGEVLSSGEDWYVAGNGVGHATAADGSELEFQFLLGGEGDFDLARYLQLVEAQGFTAPIAFEASVQCQARPDYDAIASAASIYRWMAEAWGRAGIAPD